MTGDVKELNAKNFDEFIAKGNVIVDFWAEWCGPCKMMRPVFEEVAGETKGKVKFGKVNIENEQELADRFGVLSIPTLIFFKEGEQVEMNSGFVDKKALSRIIGATF